VQEIIKIIRPAPVTDKTITPAKGNSGGKVTLPLEFAKRANPI
jgi:hypothetical protein